MLNQISSSSYDKQPTGFSWVRSITIKLPSQAMSKITQPAMAVVLILIFVLGGSIISLKASQNSKPGDSFYIAKIVSEKTHQALTFSKKEKVKLGLEFAGNRAREINQVLADVEEESEKKIERVEKLKDNFKKEIEEAKNRIAKINLDTKFQDLVPTSVVKEEAVVEEKASKSEDVETTEEDSQVFSANLGRDENGIQTSEQSAGEDSTSVNASEEDARVEEDEVLASTLTQVVDETASGTPVDAVEKASNPEELLLQAEALLDNEDYDASISKLEEADEIINPADESGEVKGESEEATTTEESVVEEEVDTASTTE